MNDADLLTPLGALNSFLNAAAPALKTPPEVPPAPVMAPGDPVPLAPLGPIQGKSFLIYTPCDDGHKLCFWESIRRFERAYYSGQLNTPHRFEVVTPHGDSLVPRARNNGLHFFLTQTQADYFFPLDSDLDFTPQDILRLADITAGRDLDFVCGRYAIKEPNLRWCENALPGKTADADGLIEVAAAPGGIHLVSRRMIQAMIAAADSWPHWRIKYTDDAHQDERWNLYYAGVVFDVKTWPDRPLGRYLSEDWGISYLARSLGYPIVCDTRTIALHRGEIFYPLGARRITAEEAAAGVIKNPDGSETVVSPASVAGAPAIEKV